MQRLYSLSGETCEIRHLQLRYFILETHIDIKTDTETEERVCGHVPSSVQY